MAVDRGGLHYSIKVENQFTAPLREFRRQVDASRRSWGAFKSQLAGTGRLSREAARNFDSMARSLRSLRQEQGRSEAFSRQRSRSLSRQAASERALVTSGRTLVQNAIRRTRVLRQEAVVVERLVAGYRELRRLQGRRISTPRGGGGGGGDPSAALSATPAAAASLNKTASAADRANASGNRLLFTFRRLFGVFAAFAVARQAADGIRTLIGRMVTFNQTVESATLGIASLITASGGVRNALGDSVGSSKALALAQKEAARQTQLLRRDGLRTAATFEQLVDTFQIAIGPGLAAGLDLDEIRRFTVQVSQAAAAAGVAQNQLSEEIRSILSGTIQQRTTRLAAVLGITNEDIRRAKEAGVLIDFLNEKFQAFTQAGEVALNTFAALSSNAADAIGQLLGAGGEEFFLSLKNLLRDVIDTLTQVDPLTETLAPDPEALKIVEGLASGLTRAVEEARRLGGALGYDDAASTAQLIGDTVGSAAEILGQLIEGFLKGANDLAGIVRSITAGLIPFSNFQIFDKSNVSTAARIGVLIGGMVLGFKTMTALAGVLQTRMLLISGRSLLLAGAAVAIGVGLAAAAGKAKQLAASTKETELSWTQIYGLVLTYYQRAIEIVDLIYTDLGFSVATTFKQAKIAVGEFVDQVFYSLKLGIVGILGLFSDTLDEEYKRLEEARAKSLKGAKEAYAKEAKLLDDFRALQQKRDKALQERFSRSITFQTTNEDAFGSIDDQVGAFGSQIGDSIKGALDGLSGALGASLTDATDQLVEGQERLESLLESLNPVIAKNRDGLEEQSELTEKITSEVQKSRQALLEEQRTLGLSGSVRTQILDSMRSRAELQQNLTKLTREESVAVRELASLQREEFQIKDKVAKLSPLNQRDYREGLKATRLIVAAEEQRAEISNKVRILELQISKARAEGNDTSILEANLQKTQQFLDLFERRVARIKGEADVLLEGGGDEVSNLIRETIELSGRQKVIEEEKLQILKDQAAVRRAFLDSEAQQLSKTAQTATFELQQENEQQRSVQGARAAGGDTALKEAVYLGEVQIKQLKEKQRLEQASLQSLIDQQTTRLTTLRAEYESSTVTQESNSIRESMLTTEQAITDLLAQQAALRESDTLTLQAQEQAQADREKRELRQANLSGDNGFLPELGQRFEDNLATLPSLAQATFDIIETSANALADTISGAIIDAFDPEKEVDLKERFAQLGKQIVNTLIQEFIRLAVVKTIINAGTSLLGGLGGGGATPGVNTGGIIGPGYVQGFSEGSPRVDRPGRPPLRVPGVHPKDTVPAMLSVGEAVIRSASSLKAGYDAMAVINSGRFDPEALRAVLGLQARKRRGGTLATKGRGYATGGVVTSGAERVRGGLAGAAVPAVMLPSEALAERLFAAGQQSVVRAVKSNKQEIKSLLR